MADRRKYTKESRATMEQQIVDARRQQYMASLASPQNTYPTGPGAALSKMLEKIGIKSSPNCSCKARARIMDEKGWKWCEENIDTIVQWLREEATKRKLPFINAVGKLIIKRAISISKKNTQKQINENNIQRQTNTQVQPTPKLIQDNVQKNTQKPSKSNLGLNEALAIQPKSKLRQDNMQIQENCIRICIKDSDFDPNLYVKVKGPYYNQIDCEIDCCGYLHALEEPLNLPDGNNRSFYFNPDIFSKLNLTRNSYGSIIANVKNVMFLDVDVNYKESLKITYKKLKKYLLTTGLTFRLYRTASGFRAICVSKEFEPKSEECMQIMKDSGTDRRYIRFCISDDCFRARLTPKPWRIECDKPPNSYPRSSTLEQNEFDKWLSSYEIKSKNYSTCRFIETIGDKEKIDKNISPIIEYHDLITESLINKPLEPAQFKDITNFIKKLTVRSQSTECDCTYRGMIINNTFFKKKNSSGVIKLSNECPCSEIILTLTRPTGCGCLYLLDGSIYAVGPGSVFAWLNDRVECGDLQINLNGQPTDEIFVEDGDLINVSISTNNEHCQCCEVQRTCFGLYQMWAIKQEGNKKILYLKST